LGNLLSVEGRDLEAVECFTKAIEINPNYAETYSNLGNSLKALGRNLQAIDCYTKAIQINPNYFNPYFNLGVVFNA